jgi:hypothetical protein
VPLTRFASSDENRPLHSRPRVNEHAFARAEDRSPSAHTPPMSLVATQSGYLVGRAVTRILAGSPLPSHHPPASRGPAEYPAVYLVGPRRYLLATL